MEARVDGRHFVWRGGFSAGVGRVFRLDHRLAFSVHSVFSDVHRSRRRSQRTIAQHLAIPPIAAGAVVACRRHEDCVRAFVTFCCNHSRHRICSYLERNRGPRYALVGMQLATVHISQIWYVDSFLWLAPFATGMFAWSAAAGVNRRDEVSAGAMAVVVMVGWGLFLALASLVIHRWFMDIDLPAHQETWKRLAVLAFSTFPGGTFLGHDLSATPPQISLAFTYVTAAVIYFLLLAWYVFRFHGVRLFDSGSRKTAEPLSSQAEWLPGPRRSPISAILWMQARESTPIAVAVFLASTGVTLVAAIGHGLSREHITADFLADVYSNTAIVFGFFVALVAGIGVCLNDVSPNINQFWRSRPIQPDVWFWVKFVTGIAMVIVSIYGPILLLGAIGLPVFRTVEYPAVLLIPMMQVAVFAAAVATICLVRRAVYAAILSIVVVYLGALLGVTICLLSDWLRSRPVDFFSDPGPLRVAIGLAIGFTISTLLAWLATRHDWGRKTPD